MSFLVEVLRVGYIDLVVVGEWLVMFENFIILDMEFIRN